MLTETKTALGLLTLCLTLPHRCPNHSFTPNPIIETQQSCAAAESNTINRSRCETSSCVICGVCLARDVAPADAARRRLWQRLTGLNFNLKSVIWSPASGKMNKSAAAPQEVSLKMNGKLGHCGPFVELCVFEESSKLKTVSLVYYYKLGPTPCL